ncbi:hypothetical protein Dsin_029154 [Dipteronia sinensis]|uniref:RING-type domain-containing protein n=1 Tax=Dipteronia sinensis TaxID=43782 RepID=A0AAE0DUX2_9ROSI|nr:hypothetical protein Dsin_029154 [Dipteronia sinensis]
MSAPVSTSVENPDPLCSICLEGVSATCGRPVVTFLCSHVFHLDRIGSAFNVTASRALCNARTVARFRKATGSSSTPGILNTKWSRTSTKMLKIKNPNR